MLTLTQVEGVDRAEEIEVEVVAQDEVVVAIPEEVEVVVAVELLEQGTYLLRRRCYTWFCKARARFSSLQHGAHSGRFYEFGDVY